MKALFLMQEEKNEKKSACPTKFQKLARNFKNIYYLPK
jgi:hypothetical protein